MKILIDTNVVIDALTSREPFNKSAEKLFIMSANNIVDMYITASSAADIYYLVRKYLHNTESSKQIMKKLYSLIGILEVREEDCIEALESKITDYEDAVLEKVARRSGMEYIITRNQKDFESGITKVILPDDFIKIIETEE
ncbi:MAG: PIN domain-containing protein [Lachnospiraceae bacterium]|nr:PIN domain-containing protein [Lachnospiraceae bacterium]